MTEKISDNVGKKIVEALKMQNHQEADFATFDTKSEEEVTYDSKPVQQDIPVEITKEKEEEIPQSVTEAPVIENTSVDLGALLSSEYKQNDIDAVFQNTLSQNLGADAVETQAQADFEYPNNVAILNHLISKLPVGVTRQTGALIIRQTMEALGIPMKSVIQEAQQLQETLISNARDCQKNIIECRKQIAAFEAKAQQYQKQAVALNDTINLFLSTGI